jgi:molecular chaperone DnaK
MGSSPEPVLGIDFGTTESKAAVVVDGRVQPILFDSRTSVPSVAHVGRGGALEIGKLDGHPARTITSTKRLLGRRSSEPEVKGILQGFTYRVTAGPGDQPVIRIDDQELAPIQVVAALLAHVKRTAERQIGQSIGAAVMAAPVVHAAGYEDALKRAAAIAGLDVRMIVPEPTAAAWGAGVRRVDGTRRIAICDFGGGTFDCALVTQTGGRLEVEAVGGDPFLGGDDLDVGLADAVAGRVFRDEHVDLRRDAVGWAELVRRSEAVKRQLSSQTEAVLRMPAGSASNLHKDLALKIPRVTSERCWIPVIDRAASAVHATLARAQWPVEMIDSALLVGGTSWVPAVQRALCLVLRRDRMPMTQMELVTATGLAIIGAASGQRVSSAA